MDVMTASALLTGVVAALGLLALIRQGWARSLGRAIHAKRTLERLTPACGLEHFTSKLGEPRTRRREGEYIEWLWIDDLYYVQAIAAVDDEDSVTRFAVTSRRTWFRPTLRITNHEYKLHHTTFEEVSPDQPSWINAQVGANRFGFSQATYLANPGHYQTVIVAMNDAAPTRRSGDITALPSGRYGSDDPLPASIEPYRATTMINTYSVTAPLTDAEDPFPIGPDKRTTRIFPPEHRWAWLWKPET